MRQKKSGKIAKLLGDKAIASACFSLYEIWTELQSKPEGIVVERDLSAPKVNPEFEAINAPSRSMDKSRVIVKLKYDKMRELETPTEQLAKVPLNLLTVRFALPQQSPIELYNKLSMMRLYQYESKCLSQPLVGCERCLLYD